MTKANELTTVVKKGRSNFRLVGELVLNDFSFKSDVVSEKSNYQYNGMNIGVKVGSGFTVYAESMGGFFADGVDANGNHRDNLLYVNDKDDFSNNYSIQFVDRFDEDVLAGLNDMNFMNVGVEIDEDTEKVIRKKFLSEYDMIEYLQQHLESGMIVNINGDVEYSIYNDEVQARKKIKNVYITNKEPSEYGATFTQTILLNKDSIGKPKDGEVEVFAQVPEYVSKINGVPVKKILALPQTYTLEANDVTKKLVNRFMKAKKGKITEITMEGDFLSSVQVGDISDEELSADMLELVEMGLFSVETALEKQNQVIKGDRGSEVKMLRRPHIKKGQGENAGAIINYCLDKYEETDILTHYIFAKKEETVDNSTTDISNENLEDGDVKVSADDESWLNEL